MNAGFDVKGKESRDTSLLCSSSFVAMEVEGHRAVGPWQRKNQNIHGSLSKSSYP